MKIQFGRDKYNVSTQLLLEAENNKERKILRAWYNQITDHLAKLQLSTERGGKGE